MESGSEIERGGGAKDRIDQIEVVMPKVGLTMTEAVIVQWHKRAGDWVAKGELLFTFETEKSTLDYESPAAGILAHILVPAGDSAVCYAPVAVLGPAGSAAPLAPAPIPQQSAKNKTPASPRAKARARELGVDIASLAGSGPDGAVVERDVLRATATAVAHPAPVNATPVAARLAAELGLDLSRVRGSGPGGKVIREDVEAAQTAPPAGPALSPARRVTAQRMTENAQLAPHVTLHTEADATALVSAREQLNAELGVKVSYNALLMAIAARALKDNPALNASWAGDRVALHERIHIGLAVDTPRGLYVPVLRDVGGQALAALNGALGDLVARTLEGKARPDELGGGTFTISNLGAYEVDAFTPILNLPEAAILGVGRIHAKPVAVDGQVVIRQMLALSLSFDHRVADGAPAAKLLQRIKQLVERPFALLA